MELTKEGATSENRYKKIVYTGSKIERLPVDFFIESQGKKQPEEIWLDLDATDDPIHSNQEGKHFHGYYDENCFLPLYVFTGCGAPLSARLRTADCGPMEGGLVDIPRIVMQLREKWPKVRIVVRGDAGFCRDDFMSWCESKKVD